MQHIEALLMAAVLGLYLYDSALLLCVNEAVLTASRKERWSVAFGSPQITLRGHELLLPNPFTPTRPMFRLAWDFERAASGAAQDWAAPRKPRRALAAAVWSLFLLLFLFLPLALFGRLGDWAIVPAFALIYANALCIAVMLWRGRREHGMRGWALAKLALDIVICPPFGLNIIRRLSLAEPIREDFIHAVQRLLSPAQWEQAKAEVLLRLDEEISGEYDAAPRMAVLLARRAELAEVGTTSRQP